MALAILYTIAMCVPCAIAGTLAIRATLNPAVTIDEETI
jgi:glycerol uptake facilitator-like aquaporin